MNSAQAPIYRSDIDALRAFAVVPVVLFHLGLNWLPGGFLGVDVFFVISGYLITGLLMRELQTTGRINLLAFWCRRILRILPALIVMVLITFIAGHIFLYAPDRFNLALNAAGALLSIGNITHWRNYGGYWSADAADSPFLHTWSLGVEEQFYILYPIALLITYRILKDRLWLLLVAGLVLGAMLYTLAMQRYPSAAFYLFPTRAWELFAGAIAATAGLKRLPGTVASSIMSLTGLVFLVGTYFFVTEEHQAAGVFISVLGAAFVVGAGSPLAFMRLGLTTQPFILVGLISYSIYLWHWPLIVFGHAIEAKHQITISPALYFVVSLFIGWLSWRFIENPIRINRHRWMPLILLIGATSTAFFIYALRDFNTKERTLNMHAARWDGELYNVNPISVWPESVHRRMQGIEVTPRPAGRIDSYLSGIYHQYGSHEKLDVMVLGDSHGLMWAPAIDAAAQDLRLNIKYMTADGTPVFFDPARPEALHDGVFFSRDQWTAFNRARLEVIRKDRPPIVIIGSAWNSAIAPSALPLLREIVEGGSQVLLIEDAPDFAIGDRNAPSYMAFLGIEPDAEGRAYSKLNDMRRKADENQAIRILFAACPSKCRVIPTRDLFEDQKSKLLVVDGGVPLFIDDDHLSVQGAMHAKSRIKFELLKAFSKMDGADELR